MLTDELNVGSCAANGQRVLADHHDNFYYFLLKIISQDFNFLFYILYCFILYYFILL